MTTNSYSQSSTTGKKKENPVGTAIGCLLSLAVIALIGVWLFNIGGYLINSQTEHGTNNITANIGGGLYIGAYESNLTTRYKFGKSDKAYAGVHYVTTEFTKLFGVTFDEADVIISTDAVRGFNYMNNGGNGRLSSIILEKKGTSKELKSSVRTIVSHVRKEAGVSGSTDGKFYRHYTLIMPNMVVELSYEGYFTHYVKVKVLSR